MIFCSRDSVRLLPGIGDDKSQNSCSGYWSLACARAHARGLVTNRRVFGDTSDVQQQ